MKFDGDSYSKISKFVSDIDDERDKVYATIEMDDDEISSITAIICDDTLEGDIKSISSSEIKIGSKTKDLKSKSIPVNVKVGDGTITSVSKLQDVIREFVFYKHSVYKYEDRSKSLPRQSVTTVDTDS